MKELELFIHGIGPDNIKLIRLSEDSLIPDVLKEAKKSGLLDDIAEEKCEVFVGDCDDPTDKKHSLRCLRIKNRDHLICHHCKKIEVSVLYNCDVMKKHFPPTATISKVLKWAIRAFELSGDTTKEMVFRLEGCDRDLSNDLRLGSLVKYPNCELKLLLTALVLVEG